MYKTKWFRHSSGFLHDSGPSKSNWDTARSSPKGPRKNQNLESIQITQIDIKQLLVHHLHCFIITVNNYIKCSTELLAVWSKLGQGHTSGELGGGVASWEFDLFQEDHSPPRKVRGWLFQKKKHRKKIGGCLFSLPVIPLFLVSFHLFIEGLSLTKQTGGALVFWGSSLYPGFSLSWRATANSSLFVLLQNMTSASTKITSPLKMASKLGTLNWIRSTR